MGIYSEKNVKLKNTLREKFSVSLCLSYVVRTYVTVEHWSLNCYYFSTAKSFGTAHS